jgi:hypothetical protein
MSQAERKLSDHDISALADEIEKRVLSRFYSDLGRGVWGLVWRALVIAIITVAAYGSLNGLIKNVK